MSDDFYDLFKPQTGDKNTPGTVVDINQGVGDSPYALSALRGEAADVAAATPGIRNDTLNRAYFNMGRHIAAGTIATETVTRTLAAAARQTGLPEREIEATLRDDDTSGASQAAAKLGPRVPPPLPEHPVTIIEPDTDDEVDFWHARPLLEHLHTFARARRVAPWAVLGVTLTRVITRTPWTVCLPPLVGGRGSLNLFVGLVGPSGTGKGTAEAAAADALDVDYVEVHTTGSGEGIAHGFRKREKGEVVWRDDTHAVLFSVAEIDTLAAQGDRRGATLMPELRRGWSGEQLGFGYADPAKRLPVPAHEYRMCMVAGIQPARAGVLLNDADGGTPQRFIWMPATDPDAPDVAPDEPTRLTWKAPAVSDIVGIGGARMEVCHAARTTIDHARLGRLRGQGDALDGHALLARLKVAAALAVADGRYDVGDEDWQLAGVVMAKSDRVREHVGAVLAAKAAQVNTARADAEADRAVHVQQRVEDESIKRVVGTVQRYLERHGEATHSETRKAVRGNLRELFDEAVDRLVKANQVVVEGDVDDTTGGPGRGMKYRWIGGKS